MKTIEEISSYIRENSRITILPSKEDKIDKMVAKSAKHIQLLLNQLVDGEEIEFAMLADAIYKDENGSSISMAGLGALVITSKKRILYGRVDIWFGQNTLESVDLTDICTVSLSLKTYQALTAPIRYGYIKIDTRNEKCIIRVRESDTNLFLDVITTTINSVRQNIDSSSQGKTNHEIPLDELKKLKELLDMNIITQEDFEEKKRQLLNI